LEAACEESVDLTHPVHERTVRISTKGVEMPDLEAIRRGIVERRAELELELEPLINELSLLRQISRTLDDAVTKPAAAQPRLPRSGVRRLGGPRAPSPAARGLQRAEQALELIGARPGITPAELSRQMEINPQYLYRVLPRLVKAGKVVKRGHGYTLAGEVPPGVATIRRA
jgi:hypothetical protein